MPKWDFSGVLMNRQLFYFSVISLTLSACSSVDSKRAQGDFDYAKKQESKEFVVPENLDQPTRNQQFAITSIANTQGPVGEEMDIRAPSLVLPLADSSRTIPESADPIIWFDKVIEDKNLLTFVKDALIGQLTSDDVSYSIVSSDPQKDESLDGTTEVIESQWYHHEVETGWLFKEVALSTSMRFRYEFYLKPHGRSLSLKVSLIDYMKTDTSGGTKVIDAIDKQRVEMAMLNEVVGQVDYNYRLQQRESRLVRANQKLVTISENQTAENAFAVEMSLDNLWDNMPIFFEKHGFTITDLNENDKIYYVDFVKPSMSIWDSIWGDDRPVIEIGDAKYQFVLAPIDDDDLRTSVTIYDSNGEPLPLSVLELIFPVMEKGLSFRNIY
jgi:outer membrane protein assembly factor BamC